MSRRTHLSPAATGLLYGVTAYAFWGIVPVYWRFLRHVPPAEILAHRMIWGLLAFGVLARLRGRMPEVLAGLRDRRSCAAMATSGALLAVNWGLFIHAVNDGRVLQASLGYFINPLVSVLLGMVFLRERLRPAQWSAVALAAVGVAAYATETGGVPWVSLTLAGSFGLYGLVRKVVRIDALPGSTIETLFMAPFAVAFLAIVGTAGGGALGRATAATHILLAGGGLVTALPLLWFALAARRLPLATVGFLQYLAPTGHFLLAVVLWREPFTMTTLASFVCIWSALAIFAGDAWRMARRPTRRFAAAGATELEPSRAD